MVFRWKDAKFSRNGIDQFFGSQPPDRHTMVTAKIQGTTAFFSKSHKNALIRVFWHAEFISALKIEQKNKIKHLIIIFYFFVIFSKCYLQNCIKTMESWFLDGKAKFGQNGIDQFFGPQPPHRHTIVRAKIQEKTLFSPNPIKMQLLG